MNAALVHSYDAPPIYTTFDAPTASEGEHLVTVAAGKHYTSTGKLPFIPAVANFFTLTATHTFDFSYKTAPLSEVTTLWNQKESEATRLVFIP